MFLSSKFDSRMWKRPRLSDMWSFLFASLVHFELSMNETQREKQLLLLVWVLCLTYEMCLSKARKTHRWLTRILNSLSLSLSLSLHVFNSVNSATAKSQVMNQQQELHLHSTRWIGPLNVMNTGWTLFNFRSSISSSLHFMECKMADVDTNCSC